MINKLKYATKSDLNIAVARLDAKIGCVETTLGSSIRELQSDMRTVKWILGFMVPILITLLIPAIQSIYLQLHAN